MYAITDPYTTQSTNGYHQYEYLCIQVYLYMCVSTCEDINMWNYLHVSILVFGYIYIRVCLYVSVSICEHIFIWVCLYVRCTSVHYIIRIAVNTLKLLIINYNIYVIKYNKYAPECMYTYSIFCDLSMQSGKLSLWKQS
jgi:hypothetical protein